MTVELVSEATMASDKKFLEPIRDETEDHVALIIRTRADRNATTWITIKPRSEQHPNSLHEIVG